jgi:hypothetical protein
MPYDYPRPLSGSTGPDIAELWNCLWRLVEALNVDEQVRAQIQQAEAEATSGGYAQTSAELLAIPAAELMETSNEEETA